MAQANPTKTLTAKEAALVNLVAARDIDPTDDRIRADLYRAAYSPNANDQTAVKEYQRVMNRPHVAQRLAEMRAAVIQQADEKLGVDAARVIEEQSRIAFAVMTDFVRWGTRDVAVKETNIVTGAVAEFTRQEAYLDVVDSDKLSAAKAAAVAEVTLTETAQGRTVRLKLQPKGPALSELAEILRMKVQRSENVNVNVNGTMEELQQFTTDQLRLLLGKTK